MSDEGRTEVPVEENEERASDAAEAADAGPETPPDAGPEAKQPVAATFAEVRSEAAGGPSGPIERVFDLEVPVHVELGRTTLTIEEILRLRPGAVVELDRPADRPVDLMVHGKRVARGEIVVVDDYYGIRITEVGGDD